MEDTGDPRWQQIQGLVMSNPRWAAANWVRPQMVGCEQEPCETPLQEGPGSPREMPTLQEASFSSSVLGVCAGGSGG